MIVTSKLLATATIILVLAATYFVNAGGEAQLNNTDPQRTSGYDDQDPFEEELLAIAEEYRTWGPVDAQASWAPFLCRSPLPSDLHHVEFRFSESDDEETHGQKIYLLYAKDREAYRKISPLFPVDNEHVAEKSEVGQVVVKQAWRPVESGDDDQSPERIAEIMDQLAKQGFPKSHTVLVGERETELPISPFLHRQGHPYRADELDSLFIMFKTDPDNEDTDNGWVYGTVSADGKTVTSSGRIDQCIACHVEAGDDRLFGLPSLFQSRRLSDDR